MQASTRFVKRRRVPGVVTVAGEERSYRHTLRKLSRTSPSTVS